MAGVKSSLPCRKLFQKFTMLSLASEFILSLLTFLMADLDRFERNEDVFKSTVMLTQGNRAELRLNLLS